MNELGRWIAQAEAPRPRVVRPRSLALRRHAAASAAGRLGLGVVLSLIFHAAVVGAFVRIADAPQGIAAVDAFPIQAESVPVMVAAISPKGDESQIKRTAPRDELTTPAGPSSQPDQSTPEGRSSTPEESFAGAKEPAPGTVGSVSASESEKLVEELPAAVERPAVNIAPRGLVWMERPQPNVEDHPAAARAEVPLALPARYGPRPVKQERKSVPLPRLARDAGPDLTLAHLDVPPPLGIMSFQLQEADPGLVVPPAAGQSPRSQEPAQPADREGQASARRAQASTATIGGSETRVASPSASSRALRQGDGPEPRLIAAQPLTPVRSETTPLPAVAGTAHADKEVAPSGAPSEAAAVPGSAVGLGFGKLVVRLEGPRAKLTDRNVETISGKVTGGPATRLVLQINDTTTEVMIEGHSFQVPVSLRRGLNRVRALATDWRGSETEDTITVEYVPPTMAGGIAITSPRDGYTLSPEDPPLIAIEGQLEDRTIQTVWLVMNDRPVPARVTDGRFRQILPVLDTVVRVWAEIPANGGPAQRSQTVTILSATPGAPTGTVVMDWAQVPGGLQAELTVTWRAAPDRVDAPVQTVSVKSLGASPHGGTGDALYLRNLRPGVYTFVLRYRAADAAELRPTLFFPRAGALGLRSLGTLPVNGSGKVVLARVLLPQGVFWEQDDWFTGQSQNAETVTKFHVPEGVTWTERKAELR